MFENVSAAHLLIIASIVVIVAGAVAALVLYLGRKR
jgi:Sec-independent protein translocase protein TatA